MSSLGFDFNESQRLSRVFTNVLADTKEMEIASRINNLRLKINILFEIIQDYLGQHCPPGVLELKFPELGKTLTFSNEGEKEKIHTYLKEQAVTNQILPDLSFNSRINLRFCEHFANVIKVSGGKMFTKENEEVVNGFFPKHDTGNLHGYYMRDLPLDHIEQFLVYLLVNEFLLLNNSEANSETMIETNNTAESTMGIGVLNKDFNSIFVYCFSADGKTLRKCSVYIMLWSGNLENLPFIAEETKDQKISPSTMTKNPKESDGLRYIDDKLPKKYANIHYATPQISKKAVIKLVKTLDQDLDNIVTFQDVQDFIKQQHLILDPTYMENLFLDCLRRRTTITNSVNKEGMSAEDIHNEIRIIQTIDPETKQPVERTRPGYEFWVMLLGMIGEKPPVNYLAKTVFKPINSNFNNHNETFHPKLYKTTEHLRHHIEDAKKPNYTKTFQPEAGIIIQNTDHIRELYINNDEKEIGDPVFSKVINAKIASSEEHTSHPSISFETKRFYNETLRLSKNPHEFVGKEINPILKFFPENPDYRAKDHTSQPIVSIGQSKTLLINLPGFYLPLLDHKTISQKGKEKTFITAFKREDCDLYRMKVAQREFKSELYYPPSQHCFREEVLSINQPDFVTRIKVPKWDEAKTKQNLDHRPRDALEKEMWEREFQKEEEMRKYREFGGSKAQKEWIGSFKLASNRMEGFVDHKYPDYLQKEAYIEPLTQINSLLRQEAEVKVQFQLYHRSLRKDDKNLLFGQDPKKY